ncbi:MULTISPECIES: Clp protease N-terminal domain-containing protein [unclassified Streptomyces]|uniref:Clp protease N-terminal domain-containing protein n=1 Tax=unclassified Streptomyces TaxID=2593676 RepID=UPI002E81AF24|nr:Clp protease N-terminal domain-containing protein [Streptomyces sp. NBC_00589]WTI36335.1 peptidase [Streptomyces sp. NBC_00775]WUB29990.1 peptidase [Streptomyces sp. NBC_00589]
MFERFTKDARAVVEGAVGHSERAGAETVGEEHLLLALFDREGSRGSSVLASLGAAGRRDSVERDLAEARRRGGLSRADVDALSGLGIDLAEIVSRVEETHGEGALESGGRRGGGRWSRRRPFAPGAKDVLTQGLRVALAHRDRFIGDEHLLMALTVRGGVVAEVLADHGVTYAAVTRVLYGDGGVAKAG